MKPEQFQPGALVYNTCTGQLYQIGPFAPQPTEIVSDPLYLLTLIGRRGETTPWASVHISQLEHFALWCNRCDGTGWIIQPDPGNGLRCDCCNGEGLIR